MSQAGGPSLGNPQMKRYQSHGRPDMTVGTDSTTYSSQPAPGAPGKECHTHTRTHTCLSEAWLLTQPAHVPTSLSATSIDSQRTSQPAHVSFSDHHSQRISLSATITASAHFLSEHHNQLTSLSTNITTTARQSANLILSARLSQRTSQPAHAS